MRILAIADVESKYYYDHYATGRFDGVDLILACGDLSRQYLEFLVTMANKPLLYVPGNHDEEFVEKPPEGCICLDGRVYKYGGVRFFGLGGSYRYRAGTYMYTEREMARRINRAWPGIQRAGGFDVMVTHAPARHVNDFDSLSHRGFSCFNALIERYHPTFFVHGHIHRNYGVNIPRLTTVGNTTVINAYDHYLFEYGRNPV